MDLAFTKAYPPAVTYLDASPVQLKTFLENIAARREFRQNLHGEKTSTKESSATFAGFGGPASALTPPGLHLTGAQTFVRDFASPNTEYKRLLIKWQTGAGKSIAAISICNEFAMQYRQRAHVGEQPPYITILGFTTRETILEDMLRFPEFGFVSAAEVIELRNLRMLSSGAAAGTSKIAAIRHLAGFLGVLRRRVTDRTRGGYYQFFGYKEFANRLFRTTKSASARGYDAETLLFARSLQASAVKAEPFGARLSDAVRQGHIEIDQALLNSLRHGLLVCDEIHNVYNILEPNNYGAAIQYALDTLEAQDAAPRAIFMSATPVTGSAAEVVDLLNLLVSKTELPDGVPLRRGDFFIRGRSSEKSADSAFDTQIAVSQLRPDALERIQRLAAGRVSFLLDADVAAYPKRIFEGVTLPNVPYLKMTPCPLPPLLVNTLVASYKDNLPTNSHESPDDLPTRGLTADAYSLNDIVFPNPKEPANGQQIGLYRSGSALNDLAAASPEWRAAAGVIVEPSGSSRIVTGTWLQAENLKNYSSKYSHMLNDILTILKGGPSGSGKLMVYHHRVHMSGVLLIAEILRMNGFATETSEVTEQTICTYCGATKEKHAAEIASGQIRPHAYWPARFAVAHSDIDRAEMLRSISRYNSIENLDGKLCRVLIGSKVVREGLNFKAVRHLFVMSMPTDYPTLLQVFGRVVRKDSHKDLPLDQRNVTIRVYVGVYPVYNSRNTPELQRYIDKGQEFLVIQQVEKALHTGAVDGFINYNQISTALGSAPENATPGLDALPYKMTLTPNQAINLKTQRVTFDAYGYGQRTILAAMAACQALFVARPVWTFPDIITAIHENAIKGTNITPMAYAKEDIAAAITRLQQPAQWPDGRIAAVVSAGPYYVITGLTSTDTTPRPDIEEWLRTSGAVSQTIPHVSVSIGAYQRNSRASENFSVHLKAYEKRYLSGDTPIELSLVELGGAFHYELLKRLIIAAAKGKQVTSNDEAISTLYQRFHIGITVGEALATATGVRLKRLGLNRHHLIGYATTEFITLYDPKTLNWFNATLTEFKYGRRHKENDIVVGFVVPIDPTGIASAGARFKLRPALQVLQRRHLSSSKTVDIRTISRGAVCETRPREELDDFVKRLRATLGRSAPKALRSAFFGDTPAPTEAEADFGMISAEDDFRAISAENEDVLGGDSKLVVNANKLADETEDAGASPVWPAEDAGASPVWPAEDAGASPVWPAEDAGASPVWPAEDAGAGVSPARPTENAGAGVSPVWSFPDLLFAARHDRTREKRFPSASELCDAVRLYILALEEKSRNESSGMLNGLRWLYLFSDKAPSIASLGSA